MAEVLLGVSGGIAAYKSVDVLRILQRRGHGVTRRHDRARPSASSGPPPSPRSRAGRSGVDLFGAEERPGYDHLELARCADLLLVAPASANTVARMAAGPRRRPAGLDATWPSRGRCVIAPAMNTRMYLHPATAANLAAAALAAG